MKDTCKGIEVLLGEENVVCAERKFGGEGPVERY